MPKKLTFEFVKSFIEKENYQLLSTEYINNRTKLLLKCNKGHIFEMKFNCFKDGKQRCPICYKNTQYNYKFVKNYIEKQGYTLLSDEYINCKKKLIIKCDAGHIFKMPFSSFLSKGYRCKKCSKLLMSSKGEKQVLNYIQNIYSGKIIENDRTQILNISTGWYLELDIYLPDINKAIEYNGDYWHSLPDKIKIDKIKVNQCKKLNIDLLIIKESEWINDKKNCLKKIGDIILK